VVRKPLKRPAGIDMPGIRGHDERMPAENPARLSDSIVVGLLETPLSSATTLKLGTPARSAVALLQNGRFDQAPVVDARGVPVGYALLDALPRSGAIDKHVRPILPGALASDRTPLADVLPMLHDTGFLFVLRNKTVSGFVVPSDLNKQPGRSYLYLGMISLELELARVLRPRFPGNSALDRFSLPARHKIEKLLARDEAERVDTDVIAELTLRQLLFLAGSHQGLIESLGCASVEEWAAISVRVCDLRNRLAHSVRPVLSRRDELGWIQSVDSLVRNLLDSLGRLV
jgi:hypothetical protein